MAKLKQIYLAGGIQGLSFEQASSWRETATKLLAPEFEAISPVCLEGVVYKSLAGGAIPEHESELVYTAPACNYIVDKDLIAIRKSVALLVNVATPSWGTAMEIIMAKRIYHKMVVSFGNKNMRSPWVLNHVHMNCDTIEDACGVLKEMLRYGYV